MIRRALVEEIEKRNSVDDAEAPSSTGEDTTYYKRVPEVVHGEDYKDRIMPHKRDSNTKDEILDHITKAVKPIDPSIVVVWDDHDDISVSARDMFRVRIIPRWENSYNIEAFVRNEDRVYVTGQDLKQVVEFLKINLKNAMTHTQKAYDKSKANGDMRNDKTPAPDKGMPQKDKPKTLPLTNEKPSETKNKEKNYTEKQVKTESDLPEKPMKDATKFERQLDRKSRSAMALRKEKMNYPPRNPNTKLMVKPSKHETSKL